MSDNREIARGLQEAHCKRWGQIGYGSVEFTEAIATALDAATERGRMQGWRPVDFDVVELDLFRQWHNAVVDLSPQYLNAADHALAAKIEAAIAAIPAPPKE